MIRLAATLSLLLIAAPLVAEDVLPNATRTVTNNACTTANAHTTTDDDPLSPGGDWCNMSNSNTGQIALQFATPSGDISTATDAQSFLVYTRRDSGTAPGNGEPTVRADAYDVTSLIETGADNTVTSDSGELITELWTSNTTDGSGIEVRVICTADGGGPNKRSCDWDAIRWIAALDGGGAEEMMVIGARYVEALTVTSP